MNSYGTYIHKNKFWEEVYRVGILHYLGLILGSDLNLTLFARKFGLQGIIMILLRDILALFLKVQF